jgi:hypothetical protein
VFVLYAVTIGLSATLLFLVQPMVALMMLPRLGGAPAIWNTAVVFYQFLLLLGYLYAHIVNTRLSAGSQVFLHAVIILLSFLVLPIVLPAEWVPPTASTPLFGVLQVLFVTVGVPFFVVSTTSPLLQSWFSRTHHQTDRDPYFLYVASNTGSLVALLAYPFLVQPHLSLPMQSSVWTLGYGIFAVLVLFLAIGFWRERKQRSPEYRGLLSEEQRNVQPDAIAPEVNVSLDTQQRLRWILLAFVPSSLMLSVTTYLVTNIAPLPLLWMIPLMLYLLTFMWAFSRVPLPPWKVIGGGLAILLPAVLLSLGIISANRARLGMLLHLLTFFIVALGCHGRLAQERPPARYLTEFYLWLSLGGVLGGMFAAIVAPVLFRVILEYPLMLILSAGLILWKKVDPDPQEQWRDLQIPLVLGGAVCTLIGVGHSQCECASGIRSLDLFCVSFSPPPLYCRSGHAVLCGAAACAY